MNIDAPIASQAKELRSLWREAFGDTEEFLDVFSATAYHPNRCRTVTDGGKTVAALYWFDCLYREKRVAYLYAIATAKAYRGRGICHKLMEDTHKHLEALGYAGTVLVPGGRELFAFYEGMGYKACTSIREFTVSASGQELRLLRIDKNEYAEMRRQLLPLGGVIQENENLTFLEQQASFYKGDGFLLAAREAEDTLYGIELLGDLSAAPQILQALGYTKGVFRTAGQGRPFAMYRPLDGGKLPPPEYFGLAFD